ncbi:MAG: hypothetical protein KatS3mg029_0503 [Saprospiraceae bacterium]|nr:MAG: hypothetical protein KatS3mg029_0503 [Saprospiraceae bacterium]
MTNLNTLLSILVAAVLYCLSPSNANAQVTLYCPEDIQVQVPPELCGAFFDWENLEFNASAPLVDTIYTPGPGFFFPIGINPILITGVAQDGSSGSCSFNFVVVEHPAMGCLPNITIQLDENCQHTLIWDDLLKPQQYGCPDDFVVDVLDANGNPLGPVVDASFLGQTWTFRVSNPSNNTQCTGILHIDTESLPPAITCPSDTVITCNTPLDPSQFGAPLITGCIDETDLEMDYTDVLVSSVCDGDSIAFFLTRTWQATDPFGNVTTCQFVITGKRITLLDVEFPPNYDGIQQPRIQCSDTVAFPMLTDTSLTGVPTVNGFFAGNNNCSFAVFFEDHPTQVCGDSYVLEREWQVFDLCKSELIKHTQVIYVVDEEPPVFAVPDTLFVSTDPACGPTSQMPPIDLVQECSEFEVEITTPFGVLHTNGGPLQIPLNPGAFNFNYTVTDACQLQASANGTIVVDADVLASCPPDTTISCTYYFENLQPALSAGNFGVLAVLGAPVLAINCDFEISENVTSAVNACGSGTITRHFQIDKPDGPLTCTQIITVEHQSDFEVLFPPDTSVSCTGGQLPSGEPMLFGVDCEDVHITMQDSVVAGSGETCYRLLRTWIVRNHCIADADAINTIDDPEVSPRRFADGGDGVILYLQTIDVEDDVPPIFTQNCSLPEVCIEGADCAGEVEIPLPAFAECSPVEVEVTSDLGTGTGPFANVSPGNYSVSFIITDQCGNQSTCSTTLEVVDCQPPIPVCFNNVTVVIEAGDPPTGMLTAEELNGLSHDNCPGTLQFSFTDDVEDDTLVFDCADVGETLVQLWVTDAAGNQDFCETHVQVQGSSNCVPVEIGGLISKETGTPIGLVMVSNGLGQTFTTGTDGTYFFVEPEPGMTITPQKDINAANGVTTFDAVLLTKHVLGTQPLDSPYKMIAADVNRSKTITTFDAVLMRKIILGIDQHFPNNTSWRFVPKAYVFPEPANPWLEDFPEVIIFENDPTQTNFDFIGIKIGDLNNSADPFNWKQEEEAERN